MRLDRGSICLSCFESPDKGAGAAGVLVVFVILTLIFALMWRNVVEERKKERTARLTKEVLERRAAALEAYEREKRERGPRRLDEMITEIKKNRPEPRP